MTCSFSAVGNKQQRLHLCFLLTITGECPGRTEFRSDQYFYERENRFPLYIWVCGFLYTIFSSPKIIAFHQFIFGFWEVVNHVKRFCLILLKGWRSFSALKKSPFFLFFHFLNVWNLINVYQMVFKIFNAYRNYTDFCHIVHESALLVAKLLNFPKLCFMNHIQKYLDKG